MYKTLLTIFLSILLTACGFHLRGSETLSPQLQQLHLETPDAYSVLTTQLEQALQSLGIQLIPDSKNVITLQILTEKFSRQVNSIGSSGQNTVYVLTYSVTYQLRNHNGEIIQGPNIVSTTRNYSVGSSQVLGDISTERDLQTEMRRDVIYQLLNQLTLHNTLHTLKNTTS